VYNLTDHYCMVFETLGISLYDLVKRNDYKRLPLECVRDVARQLMQALDFLQSIQLIHTGTLVLSIQVGDCLFCSAR
jgi:dual-specificity kinase